jgi:hypothetical protein
MVHPRVAPYLPDNVWQALLEVNKHVETLTIDDVENESSAKGLKFLR